MKHVGGSGLLAGSIAGNVIAVLVRLGLAAGLAFFFLRRSRRRIRQPTSEQSNNTNNSDSAGYQEKDGSTRAELHDHPLPLEVAGKSVLELPVPLSEVAAGEAEGIGRLQTRPTEDYQMDDRK